MKTVTQNINDIAIKKYKGNNSSFAKDMNTSESNIRNYRKGTMPKLDFIIKLHDFFEISFDSLLAKEKVIFDSKMEIKNNPSNSVEDLENRLLKFEIVLLKEKLDFQKEQIEFYKSRIDFLATQTKIKKAHNSRLVENGLNIINEIEKISSKKSVK
jgi:transcriptional regulator with XRE-family HTH domain